MEETTSWESLAATGDLEAAIVTYIATYDWVTFVELKKQFEPYCNVHGSAVLSLDKNIVLWAGMSDDFCDTIIKLLDEQRVHLHPTIVLTYLFDGGVLRMPLVKRPPKNGYREPRWLPACLRVVP